MSFPDICPGCGHLTMMPHVDGCDAAGADDDAEKAALFDVLTARINPDSATWAESWDIYQGANGKVMIQTGMQAFVEGATLAEAVKRAMESEGKEK